MSSTAIGRMPCRSRSKLLHTIFVISGDVSRREASGSLLECISRPANSSGKMGAQCWDPKTRGFVWYNTVMKKPQLKELEVLIGNWDWTMSNAWFLDSLESKVVG